MNQKKFMVEEFCALEFGHYQKIDFPPWNRPFNIY